MSKLPDGELVAGPLIAAVVSVAVASVGLQPRPQGRAGVARPRVCQGNAAPRRAPGENGTGKGPSVTVLMEQGVHESGGMLSGKLGNLAEARVEPCSAGRRACISIRSGMVLRMTNARVCIRGPESPRQKMLTSGDEGSAGPQLHAVLYLTYGGVATNTWACSSYRMAAASNPDEG